MTGKHNAGKGSRYRKINQKKWEEGWEKAFGKKKPTPKKPKGKKINDR